MKYILFILLLLLSVGVASADFNTNLALLGLPQDAISHDLGRVHSYSYSSSGDSIVGVTHTAPYGVVIDEHYFVLSIDIHISYSCTNLYFETTCSYSLDDGTYFVTGTTTQFDFGVTGQFSTDAAIVYVQLAYLAGINNIRFGVGPEGFANSGYQGPGVVINSSALMSAPIISVSGTASSDIGVVVQTLSFEQYSKFITTQANQAAETTSLVSIIQSFVMGILSVCVLVIEHPILIFAYVEIFAFLYALKARDIEDWWVRYIGIHGDILQFIFSNAQAIIIALVIVSVLGIIGLIVGV